MRRPEPGAGGPASAGRGLAFHRQPGAGERVLWIHGYTLDSSIWPPLWDLLPDEEHVAIDLPGHGGSDPIAPDDTLAGLGRRLAELVEELGVRHLVGLSFGGTVALEAARHLPSLGSLSLSSPGLGGGPREPSAQTRNLELHRLFRERGAGPWLGELWMRSPPDIFRGAESRPELYARLRAVVSRHRWDELADHRRMQAISDGEQPLAALRRIRAGMVQVFVGEGDMPAFLRTAELLRRTIPRCRRVYVPGAGHLSLLERPDEAAPWLREAFAARSPSDDKKD